MKNITRINIDGTMNDVSVSVVSLKTIIKHLDKLAVSKGSTDLKQLYRWNYGDKEIYCYGWYDGQAGFENKHDLIPNGNSTFLCDEDSSEKLLFGDIFLVSIISKTKRISDFCVSDYAEMYSDIFEGFDECNTSDEEEDDNEEETEEDLEFINDDSEDDNFNEEINDPICDEEELDEDYESYTEEEEEDPDIYDESD